MVITTIGHGVITSRSSHSLAPLVSVLFTAWVEKGYHLPV